MTKKQFMQTLGRYLGGVSEEDKQEILGDYEEHFRIGAEEGKSEETIAASLGDPGLLGRTIKVEYYADRAEDSGKIGNATRAVFASLSLGLFNLIFVVGPYAGLIGVLAGLWATAVALAVSGFATVLASIFEPLVRLFVPYVYEGAFWMHIAAFFIGTFLLSLGGLACIGMIYLSKWFFALTARYIRFNAKIIKKG